MLNCKRLRIQTTFLPNLLQAGDLLLGELLVVDELNGDHLCFVFISDRQVVDLHLTNFWFCMSKKLDFGVLS